MNIQEFESLQLEKIEDLLSDLAEIEYAEDEEALFRIPLEAIDYDIDYKDNLEIRKEWEPEDVEMWVYDTLGRIFKEGSIGRYGVYDPGMNIWEWREVGIMNWLSFGRFQWLIISGVKNRINAILGPKNFLVRVRIERYVELKELKITYYVNKKGEYKRYKKNFILPRLKRGKRGLYFNRGRKIYYIREKSYILHKDKKTGRFSRLRIEGSELIVSAEGIRRVEYQK